MGNRDAKDRVQEILTVICDAADMTVATVRDDGYPQATTVSYVSDGLTIYFGSDPNSQKARNIARNSKVSLTILPYTSWDTIRGLSMGAIAQRVTGPSETLRVQQLMLAKFPEIAKYVSAATGDVALFRITPQVISPRPFLQPKLSSAQNRARHVIAVIRVNDHERKTRSSPLAQVLHRYVNGMERVVEPGARISFHQDGMGCHVRCPACAAD